MFIKYTARDILIMVVNGEAIVSIESENEYDHMISYSINEDKTETFEYNAFILEMEEVAQAVAEHINNRLSERE